MIRPWVLVAGLLLLAVIVAGGGYAIIEYQQNKRANAAYIEWEQHTRRADAARSRYVSAWLSRKGELTAAGMANEAADDKAKAEAQKLGAYKEMTESEESIDRLSKQWADRWKSLGLRPR
jgi:uncharacterized protein HemX